MNREQPRGNRRGDRGRCGALVPSLHGACAWDRRGDFRPNLALPGLPALLAVTGIFLKNGGVPIRDFLVPILVLLKMHPS